MWSKTVVAAVVAVSYPEKKSATKARFDPVAVDSYISTLAREVQVQPEPAGTGLLSRYQAP